MYRMVIKYIPRFPQSLPPLHRQHSAAIGCTKNYQPIGATVHSHCELWRSLRACRRGRGCSESWKYTFFSEHPVIHHFKIYLSKSQGSTFIHELKSTEVFHKLEHQSNPSNQMLKYCTNSFIIIQNTYKP